MSDENYADKDVENDPERTLITLDQLSQTIEVMTSVVNRLRRHLSEQIKAKVQEQAEREKCKAPDSQIQVSDKVSDAAAEQAAQRRESFVVEISQQETDPVRKTNKILH